MNQKRVIFNAKLELLAPLLISSGNSNIDVDIQVIKDSNGIPFIPATSFIGVLKSIFSENYDTNKSNKLFGFDFQSSIKCHDLKSLNIINTEIRDGIKIDRKTNITKDGSKYNYEVVPFGSKFNIILEFYKENEKQDEELFKSLLTLICNSKFNIGAKTTSGFGRVQISEPKVYELDFSNREQFEAWLEYDFSKTWFNNNKETENYILPEKNHYFNITMDLSLKNSIIIKDYNSNIYSDAQSLKSNGKYVISGTSFKGVLSNRIEKILNTLDIKNPKKIMDELFGTEEKENTRKGRVFVDEYFIENIVPEIQNRVKIDRFTGGTINSALFNNTPLWNTHQDEKNLSVEIRVKKPKQHEIGLLLLACKDLFEGDLTIGGEKNIGRGVFKGLELNINNLSYKNQNNEEKLKPIKITSFKNNVSKEHKKILEPFIQSIKENINNA